jgi:hypothetical protein
VADGMMIVFGFHNKSQMSISLSSFLLILSKIDLRPTTCPRHGRIIKMIVSICPTTEVVNNPVDKVVRNIPLFGRIQGKSKHPHL